MANTLRSKTLTASLPADPRATFDYISDAVNLPQWYGRLSRAATVRFVRDDRAHVLDLILDLGPAELAVAIRVLPNGTGSEIILTLIQPRGLPDNAFLEQTRWAGSALAELKKFQSREAPPSPKATADEPVPVTSASGLPAEASAEASKPAPEASPVRTGKKLFVGNLPFAWTEDPLRELFAAHGTVVTAAIARLRGRGGRSRGFGFVEMSTEAEAQIAIEKLHEGLAGDRKMVVRLARSQESRDQAPGQPASGETAAPAAAARPAAPRNRSGRGGRPGRGPRPTRGPRPDSSRAPSDRPRRETGISNNSGYEFFPRDSKGGFATKPTARSSGEPRSSIEPSPYMDDTGDIENHGSRSPRRRRR